MQPYHLTAYVSCCSVTLSFQPGSNEVDPASQAVQASMLCLGDPAALEILGVQEVQVPSPAGLEEVLPHRLFHKTLLDQGMVASGYLASLHTPQCNEGMSR